MTTNHNLLTYFGLKFNPFAVDLPHHAIYVPARLESFCRRIESSLVREGGFAMISGDPGTGKSVAMRLLAERLSRFNDLNVGAITHPQSSLADLYRELGELFGVSMRPNNRWGGFTALRQRWISHMETTRMRAVLLVDEAQEMSAIALNELRLLASAKFDSQQLLSIVLAGDGRLPEKFLREDLLPLGSRIRTRYVTGLASSEALKHGLAYLLDQAGNAHVITEQLQLTLCDHANGNYRTLANMACDLLNAAAERELSKIDEKLYFEVFDTAVNKPNRRAGARR